MSGANERLSGANERLSGANERLSGANERLSGANERLSGRPCREEELAEMVSKAKAGEKQTLVVAIGAAPYKAGERFFFVFFFLRKLNEA